MTPSQVKRKPKRSPKRPKRDSYDVDAYRRAITYGIEKANRERVKNGQEKIPHWFPLQLRHSRATEIRKVVGVEGAQLVLATGAPTSRKFTPSATKRVRSRSRNNSAEAMTVIFGEGEFDESYTGIESL